MYDEVQFDEKVYYHCPPLSFLPMRGQTCDSGATSFLFAAFTRIGEVLSMVRAGMT